MKMLFRNGKIGENAQGIGIEKISFISNDAAVLSDFDKSLWQVMGLLYGYDVELYKRINEKDVFYFYDKRVDKNLIIDELDTIIQKESIENVVNYEDTMIKEAIEDIDLNRAMGINNGHKVFVKETIFWDVHNHFVVIIGRNELARFAYTLEEEKIRKYLSAFPNNTINDFISEETMSNSVKKMLLLADQNNESI